MSEEDNKTNRIREFKGSLAIIIIYAVFIFIISIAGIVSSGAREIIFVQNRAFTVTFITGTVIIIIIMLINLFRKREKPETLVKSNAYSGENLECPDFWVLKETPQTELDKISDLSIRQKLKYYCEDPRAPKTDIAITHTDYVNYIKPIKDIVTSDPEINVDEQLMKIRDTINTTYDPSNNVIKNNLSYNYHMTCNRMYPDYMTHTDITEFPDNPTTLRCEYIKKCNADTTIDRKIPWSSLCS